MSFSSGRLKHEGGGSSVEKLENESAYENEGRGGDVERMEEVVEEERKKKRRLK